MSLGHEWACWTRPCAVSAEVDSYADVAYVNQSNRVAHFPISFNECDIRQTGLGLELWFAMNQSVDTMGITVANALSDHSCLSSPWVRGFRVLRRTFLPLQSHQSPLASFRYRMLKLFVLLVVVGLVLASLATWVIDSYDTTSHLKRSLGTASGQDVAKTTGPPYPGGELSNIFWFVQVSCKRFVCPVMSWLALC